MFRRQVALAASLAMFVFGGMMGALLSPEAPCAGGRDAILSLSEATVLVGSGSGEAGESVEVPISLQGADGFLGIEFLVEHDERLASVESVQVSGLGFGSFMAWRSESGKVHIAMAKATGFFGDGEFCRIVYGIQEGPEVEWSDLTCVEARVDEDPDLLETMSGWLALTNVLTVWDGGGASALSFAVCPASPNPFGTATDIRFDLAQSRWVYLTIYDVRGRPVRNLVNGMRPAKAQVVTWDGRDDSGREVPSGMYFMRLATGEFSACRKLLVAR